MSLILVLVLALGGSFVLAPATPAAAEANTSDKVCGKTASKLGIESSNLPDLICQKAMLMSKEGTIYYARDIDKEIKIASTTKIMTAIVTLDTVKLDDTLTVSKAAANVGGSSANLKEGDTLTVEQALRGLMIPSGNDAATALGEFVGKKLDSKTKKPLKTFVTKMNETAKKLGCSHTTFTNPHGLDADEWAGNLHSTTRDVMTMFAYAMKNDTFRKIIAETDSTIKVKGSDGNERTWKMDFHNQLLNKDGNIGGKTGTTHEAGFCNICAYDKDGREFYIAVMHSDSNDHRYTDTATLASWFFSHQKTFAAAQTNAKTLNGNPLIARMALSDWSNKTIDVTLKNPDEQISAFSLDGDVTCTAKFTKTSGDIKRGEKVGTLDLKQNGSVFKKIDLVSDEDSPAPTIPERGLVLLDRLCHALTGAKTAETRMFQKTTLLTINS